MRTIVGGGPLLLRGDGGKDGIYVSLSCLWSLEIASVSYLPLSLSILRRRYHESPVLPGISYNYPIKHQACSIIHTDINSISNSSYLKNGRAQQGQGLQRQRYSLYGGMSTAAVQKRSQEDEKGGYKEEKGRKGGGIEFELRRM